MYHLLIVDDEKYILDGLYDLFDQQEELELTVYRAASAFDAMTVLAQTKIDIVLTDIRMPKMSGLEMVEQVKSNWPRCKVIFLTGFDEFDYVYKAIQQGNVKYMLKSDGDSNIVQAVADSILEIEESLSMESLLADARESRRKQTDHMRSLFFTDFLEGLLSADDDKQSVLQQLDIRLSRSEPLLVSAVRIEGIRAGILRHELDDLFIAVQTICHRYLSPLANVFNTAYNRTYLVLLLQPQETKKSSWDRLATFFNGTLDTIQRACRKNLGLTISFSWMTEPVQWEAVPQKFSFLKLLFLHYSNERQIVLTEKNMQEIEKLRTARDNAEQYQPLLKQIGLLAHFFETGQKDFYFHSLEAIAGLLQRGGLNQAQVLEIYYSLALHGLSIMNKMGLGDDPYYKESIGRFAARNLPSGWDEALAFFRELAHSFFDYQDSQGMRMQDDVIVKIKRFIKENLKEDLSLTRLSEQVFLNPDYLSRLFRQREGGTITEYITSLKISEAKSMLKQSHFLVQDVARQLGFSTAGYFTRFFKKETGLTPEEYRSSL